MRMGKPTGRLVCVFICCVWGEYTNGAEPTFCPGLYGDCQKPKTEEAEEES